ncbi:lipase [Malassezia pachydermatis]
MKAKANAFKHYVRFFVELGSRTPRESANEFLYDQLFHMIKKLVVYLTNNTTEDVQKLTDQAVPVPPWCYNEIVMIPMESLDKSADLLHQYFGPEMMQSFIGGSRWWQIRSQPGVPGEWISHYSDYHSAMAKLGRKASYSTGIMHRMTRSTGRVNPRHEHKTGVHPDTVRKTGRFADTEEETNRLFRVMLYLHGGAYYFGSVNTHKYAILKEATKFGGFAFAVNYRKAPQFPFPCALQDCLAAYLYLIDPPPGSLHPAINPEHIIVGGDSAGGGLTLALLQLIRDLGLPPPAGAVLLSPWSDMSHSFPSILQNTESDYIPPYSFIHKPSVLWPLPKDTGRFAKRSWLPFLGGPSRRRDHEQAQAQMPAHAQPIFLTEPGGTTMPIKSQIQFYCTNAQVFHPLCSPALAASLGGLPPLYIMVGDGEVLRDEVLYVAHKAANPAQYPLGSNLMDHFPNTRATFERYKHSPTTVHLQLYDEQCHVFPLFMYTTAARVAFEGMASFIKHVTGAPTNMQSPWARAAGSAPAGENKYSGKVPLDRPQYLDNMIRERVSTTGKIRPMEPPSEMAALRMAPDSVGTIKPMTYKRFQKGHTIWDTKFAHEAAKVKKRRAKYERRAKQLLAHAQAEGLLDNQGDIVAEGAHWYDIGTYGPADLHNEMPPPSAIVGRRDTVCIP